jgi:ribonuclease P protein component
MLQKSKRFTKEDFSIARPKFFFRGELFDSAYIQIPNATKFACVISKKTLKESVKRNKVKRRFFNCLKSLEYTKQYSIIFYPKKESYTTSYFTLQEKIKEALEKLQ